MFSLRASAIPLATMHACTIANAETKQKPKCRAPFNVYAANKKSEHASTKSQRHDGYSEGYTLQHVNFQKAGLHPPRTECPSFPAFVQLASMVDLHEP
jgi:hypothetical protein